VLRICPKTIDVYVNSNLFDKAIYFLQSVYEDRVNIIDTKNIF